MEQKIIGVVSVPPKTNIISVLSNAGYTIQSAIADIIDNSVANHAKTIEILFFRDGKNSFISITDDGDGIGNETKLLEAMTYAPKATSEYRSDSDLGRYGVGMKAASSSFCDNLQVISKSVNSNESSYMIDFKCKNWDVFKIQTKGNEIKTKTGTKIICTNLKFFKNNKNITNDAIFFDEEVFSNIVSSVYTHIARVFGLLIGNDLKIMVNGNVVKPWNPFVAPGLDVQKVFSEKNGFSIKGHPVLVESYILPVFDKMDSWQKDYVMAFEQGSMVEREGFYVYRNNRLIVDGGWLNIKNLKLADKYKYARIGIFVDSSYEVDEYLSVNFLKNNASIPEDFANYLYRIAKDARKRSIKSFNFGQNSRPYLKKGNGNVDSNVWEIIDDGTVKNFRINRNNKLIKKYTNEMSSKKKEALFSLLEEYFSTVSQTMLFFDKGYTDDQLKRMLKEEVKNFNKIGKNYIEILKMRPFCKDEYKTKSRVLLLDIFKGEDNECKHK